MMRARFYPALALTAALLSWPSTGARAENPPLPDRAPIPTMLPSKEQFGPPQPPPDAMSTMPPVPTPRPAPSGLDALVDPDPANPPEVGPPAEEAPKYIADERSGVEPEKTLPANEVSCRKRLDTLGAEFQNETSLASPDGCSLPYPVSLRTLAPGISLDPPATMDCAMAEAASRFVAGQVQKTVGATYGKGVKSVGQASAYVCRPRNGTTKFSEHAFGNALDIATITLDDGTALTVGDVTDAKAMAVLGEIRKAACGPFKTVLGPGSDADHATHLHVDLAPRRNGALYCH